MISWPSRSRPPTCGRRSTGSWVAASRPTDREQAWWNYRAFADGWGTKHTVSYHWNHGYGPIDWPREGIELFRVTP